MNSLFRLGAQYKNGNCRFCVWAPKAKKVEIHITSPSDNIIPMKRKGRGYFQLNAENIEPGATYFYRLDKKIERPDPASRFQPYDVHRESQVVDLSFEWQDNSWQGIDLKDYIIYELHTGTYTGKGTFQAIIPHLAELKELGITAIELMPVAQFPGTRNWGYDGVSLFAAQNSYGGYRGLQELVNACHKTGLAVILDVVYNHIGPEGNYLRDFGYYFTDRYCTPWGEAVNFDGPYSDEVRRFVIENALHWIRDFHIDALRLDAIHAIMDQSPITIVQEIATEIHKLSKKLNRIVHVIVESHLNDSRVLRLRNRGGYGVDAQWSDDFHHSLHVLLTGEVTGYYIDFKNKDCMAKALKKGYTYTGEYAPFWIRKRGSPTDDIPAERFVVFSQNHDQIGNRMFGERLSNLTTFEGMKLAAAAVILSPYLPLFFMGEEYGETAHFPYFVSHTEKELIEAVRNGRKAEFSSFNWTDEPPDPQDKNTFLSAKLDHKKRKQGDYKILYNFYRYLIQLRKILPPLADLNKKNMDVRYIDNSNVLHVRRWSGNEQVIILFNFSNKTETVTPEFPDRKWSREFDSSLEKWGGKGSKTPDTVNKAVLPSLKISPQSVVLYTTAK